MITTAGAAFAALASFLDVGGKELASVAPLEEIVCEGAYDGHLQGTDAVGTNIWWSFTKTLVRTDLSGRILASRYVAHHHGDLCVKGDLVYVAVNIGRFNSENRGVSCVIAYDAMSLDAVKMWTVDQPHGAGGMTWKGDRFYVVGGLPPTHEQNYVYEYDSDFNLLKRHAFDTGFTWMGIQTAAYLDGEFLFGIYGDFANPEGILRCPSDLSSFRRYVGDGSIGFAKIGGKIYTATTPVIPGEIRQWSGRLRRTDDIFSEGRLFAPPWCPNGTAKGVPVRARRLRYGIAGRDFDPATWREVTEALPEKGYNAVAIDAADAIVYGNHPERFPDGAAMPKAFKAEIERLLALGLETIPVLDFSEERGAWLGALRHPAASEETRKAFAELITCIEGTFGHTRLVHVVDDCLSPEDREVIREAVYRRGYGSRIWPAAERPGDVLDGPACATIPANRAKLLETR